MAKLSTVCDRLCLFLLFSLRISSVLAANEHYLDYETYDAVHHREEHSLAIESVENQAQSNGMQKRDIPVPQMDSTSPLLQGPTKSPLLAISNATEVVPKKFIPTNSIAKDGGSNPNLTRVQLEKQPIRLLGENGTGIRLNITGNNSTMPKMDSKPTAKPTTMVPILHNDTLVNTKKSNWTVSVAADATKFTDSDDDLDDLVDVSEEAENRTLSLHNITIAKTDFHVYYNSTFKIDKSAVDFYWVDINSKTGMQTNEVLSNSYRKAAIVTLTFPFTFYGHIIRNVTIATGGFLYTGDYVHSWLASTQYIAPLMANFDTSLSNESFVKYLDNGTAFTVQWEKVALQDRPSAGEFTFQTTLFDNGDIVFVYKDIPSTVADIKEDQHPVKIGLSDAYIIDQSRYSSGRKTIYEYHRVNFEKDDIGNSTVIYLKALPTCLDNKDCSSCLSAQITMKCTWCPQANKCSSGYDRYRQSWMSKGCDKRFFINETCSEASVKVEQPKYSYDTNQAPRRMYEHESPSSKASKGVSTIVAVLLLLAMVTALGVWVLYAYRNPHTTSGQILIRYRPNQWRWRRGEPRYVAATIHM